jgi:hypothetical protein
VAAPSSAVVTIGDDDVMVVTITATDATADEETLETGYFTVTRAGGALGNLTVNFTVGGSATSGTDYSSILTSVVIPDGFVSATVTVTPGNDPIVEGSETVVVTLAAGAGYSVGTPSSDTVTITESD